MKAEKTIMNTQKIKALKGKEKITMLTVYDALSAGIFFEAGIDILLVGDSLGTTLLGYKNTLPVTLEEMLHHTRAVRKGAPDGFIVADMPFLSYGISIEESVKNAGRLIQEGGADAVKLEGGEKVSEHIRAMVDIGIPVMGHLGLLPQSVLKNGYTIAGRSKKEELQLISLAKVLEVAGVFSLVLEGTTVEVAKKITEEISVPTIGIGAGNVCDGQVLVSTDMLGFDKNAGFKHNKKYVDLNDIISKAVKRYIEEVKKGDFPTEFNSFHMKEK